MFHMPGRLALLRFGTGRLGLLSDRKRAFHLKLECTDLHATYTKFEELGIPTVGPPTTRPSGERDSWYAIPTETFWNWGHVTLHLHRVLDHQVSLTQYPSPISVFTGDTVVNCCNHAS